MVELQQCISAMNEANRNECTAVLKAIAQADTASAVRLWKRLVCTLEDRYDAPTRAFVRFSGEWLIQHNAGAVAGQIANVIGAMYDSGEWGEQSFEQAVAYYQQAEALGDVTANENLGFCYLYGKGLTKDFEQAYQHFVKAALRDGSLTARYLLGDMYFHGWYVAEDDATSYALYRSCFEEMQERGYEDEELVPVAMRLGCCLHHGYGVDKEPEQATMLLEFAEDVLQHSSCLDGQQRAQLAAIQAELADLKEEERDSSPAPLS